MQFGCSCYGSEAVVTSLLQRGSAVQRASVESCGDRQVQSQLEGPRWRFSDLSGDALIHHLFGRKCSHGVQNEQTLMTSEAVFVQVRAGFGKIL